MGIWGNMGTLGQLGIWDNEHWGHVETGTSGHLDEWALYDQITSIGAGGLLGHSGHFGANGDQEK